MRQDAPIAGAKLPIPTSGDAPFRQEIPAAVEDLDTVIAGVRDIDPPGRIHRHAEGIIELAVPAAVRPPLDQVVPAGIEHLDAAVK